MYFITTRPSTNGRPSSRRDWHWNSHTFTVEVLDQLGFPCEIGVGPGRDDRPRSARGDILTFSAMSVTGQRSPQDRLHPSPVTLYHCNH